MDSKSRTLSKGKEKIYLSWDTYISYINELSNLINKSNIYFDYVYGICRGGLIPATIISHALDKKLLVYLSEYLSPNDVLVVDDVVDSGHTMQRFIDRGYRTACIYKQTLSPLVPDFYYLLTDKWVQFPYEKD